MNVEPGPADAAQGARRAADPHRVAMFAVVATAMLMSSLDSTIVATALHTVQHGLGASVSWAGWTITAYSLGLVVMLPLAGKLGDQYGQRRVFLGSVAVFTAASLSCAVATNIYLLVALRFAQAIGGAGFNPTATGGIVVQHFGSARDKVVGLFGSIFPIGAMVGPILGGVFVTYLSWRAIFLVNVPIGLTLIPLCLRYIPRDRPRSALRPAAIDVTGLGLLGGGLLAVMLGLSSLGPAAARRPWLPVLALAVAVGAFAGFARHVRRTANPIIAPRLIYGRGFGAVNVINIVCGGAVSGLVALLPLYATTRYGIPALGSGTLLIAQGVAVTVLSTLGAVSLRRTGYRWPLYAGSLAMAAGLVMLAVAPHGAPPYLWLALAAGVVGAGMGWINPASRNAGLQLAPEHSASIAAMRTAGRQLGTIGAVSVATAVIAAAGDPAAAQAAVYAICALLLVITVPMVHRIPEHRGSW